jgi:predicted O-linked N-acetylglucosamine transferase (SPINDLY family)
MTYDNAIRLYPRDLITRKKYMNETFKKYIAGIPLYVKTNEMNIKTSPFTYVFEHIRNNIIDIISLFVSPEERRYISDKNWIDIKYRKKIFDVLIELEHKSIMMWMFFHFNYFNLTNLDQQRKILMENIEIFYKYYPQYMYFSSIAELYECCSSANLLFSISYQNRNNKVILENYSKLIRKICPDINYEANQFNIDKSLDQTNPLNRKKVTEEKNNKDKRNQNRRQLIQNTTSQTKKIKVCFFSEFLTTDSSVLRDRMGIITQLPSDKYDVFYMSFTKPENIRGTISKSLYNKLEDKYIQPPENIIEARKFIGSQQFDIIVYCEIGMLMRPLYLSYARLAPIQVTTWGHSETSGINTIDYFVSSKYFEIEESKAQTHYSEKLYLMNSLSTYYYQPTKMLLPSNYVFKTRKDFGLDDRMIVYCCIQSSFKISEEFEKMMNGILKGNPNARILMSTNKPFCNSQVKRLNDLMGPYDYKRLLFYPALNISSYINILKLSDVMLDPYPFGGCNTSFEAFDLNIPVVTMPTKYLNGRFTFGMYKKMGFIDMVADSPENYVKIAIRAGIDVRWRDSIKEKINRNKILLFQETESLNNWNEFLTKIYNISQPQQLQPSQPSKPTQQTQPTQISQSIELTETTQIPQPTETLVLDKNEVVNPIDLESWATQVNNTNLEINENENENEFMNDEAINEMLDEVMQESLNFDTFLENS